MKYLKERKLAQTAMKHCLGYAPSLENILPLESSENNGECTHVMFLVRGHKDIEYWAGERHLSIHFKDDDKTIEVNL